MRIALIASPFISVPPVRYGGTELFIAHLAEGLQAKGIEAVVYCNGESTVDTEVRSCYSRAEWPLASGTSGMLKELDHLSWSINDAAKASDLIHINSASAITFSRYTSTPFLCTLHHPFESALTRMYERYREIQYVAISAHQASVHPTLAVKTIHHGIDLTKYRLQPVKEDYLCFLGRVAPIKGVHVAIDVAKLAGIPLKIAGEIQPMFQEYFDTMVKPHLDGRSVEYVGEVDLEMKNRLLGNSRGLLFPIQWEEPFGLVMLEAMACGTPVFSLPGGAVPEIVKPGVSGEISQNAEEMAAAIAGTSHAPETVRDWVEKNFSVELMVQRYIDLYQNVLSGGLQFHAPRSLYKGVAA
ncbi:MAG TPA: glycosyltransferase family 4 protein [Edaphobacter sp.]|nr:glycosyltransferase family 4 protein [Edaphobacter sp.]